jgi:uncharacterized protein with HEPN domain
MTKSIRDLIDLTSSIRDHYPEIRDEIDYETVRRIRQSLDIRYDEIDQEALSRIEDAVIAEITSHARST